MEKRHVQLLLGVVMALTMTAFAPPADAYQFYSDDSGAVGDGTQNCAACHGEFRAGEYVSLAEGVSWGTHLHAVHLTNTTVGSNCDNCHGGVGSIQRGTNLSSSALAADNANPISCAGCHGRFADANNVAPAAGAGWGAGLRQHHQMAGVGICLPCHGDSDPGAFTTAPENTMPPWYGSVTNNNTGTTLAPCNENGEENLAGAPSGLDNNGNLLYDTADPTCAPLPPCPDMDNDGYAVCDATCDSTGQMCGDCNDMDLDVNPGVIEAPPGSQVCTDTVDNDCDGLVDGADPGCLADCTDNDMDGYYAEGGACGPMDCDDNDPAVNPGATELCNGIDDDCDGLIDEDFNVGEICTVGLGVCENTGSYICTPDGLGTECSATPFPPQEEPEMSCQDGLDNDCDGLTDDAEDPDCGAAVMPPPVNQFLAIPDVSFTNLTEADCRFCHNQNPPVGIPVDPTYLPDRHHLLVGTEIPPVTAVPHPDADGDTVPDTFYDCLNCHTIEWNPATGSYEIVEDFRNCVTCHTTSPHHTAVQATSGNCSACHGDFVDRGLFDTNADGYADTVNAPWVPTYQPSLVTPWPSSKGDPNYSTPYTGGQPANSRGTLTGNCDYCHDSGEIVNGIPDFIGKLAQDNYTNHHDTGIPDYILPGNGNPEAGDVCTWCHYMGDNTPQPMSIRTCENCHGIPSLHNIQAKNGMRADDSNPIQPGAEDPYSGHIGNNIDCNGCHGFAAASAPSSGPVIPSLSGVSASSVPQGADTTVTLTGDAFVNQVQNPMTGTFDVTLTADVALTDANGAEILLAPSAASVDTLEVVIPGYLAAGNYKLAAKKVNKYSNPKVISVTPQVAISSASCTGGTVTIDGSGFGADLGADRDGTSVTATVTTQMLVGYDKKGRPIYETTTETVEGQVSSWTDTQIVADFADCPASVTVEAVYGSASAALGSSEPPTDPPTGRCADYADQESCSADPACDWSVNKKGRGSCADAGGGGKPPKNK